MYNFTECSVNCCAKHITNISSINNYSNPNTGVILNSQEGKLKLNDVNSPVQVRFNQGQAIFKSRTVCFHNFPLSYLLLLSYETKRILIKKKTLFNSATWEGGLLLDHSECPTPNSSGTPWLLTAICPFLCLSSLLRASYVIFYSHPDVHKSVLQTVPWVWRQQFINANISLMKGGLSLQGLWVSSEFQFAMACQGSEGLWLGRGFELQLTCYWGRPLPVWKYCLSWFF